MSRHRRPARQPRRTDYLLVLAGFHILALVAAMVAVLLWTVAYLTSGVSANSTEVAERFARPELDKEGRFVIQGGELKVVFARDDGEEGTRSSCTVAAAGTDPDGVTVLLTARHCLEAGPIKRLEVGRWAPDFEILWPESTRDYVFVRLPGFTPVPGSPSIRTEVDLAPVSACRQGFTDLRPVICGRAWMWDGDYISTTECYYGDSGGPLTTSDRSELLGVVSRMSRPRPGVSLCVSTPTTTIMADVAAGRVPGLAGFRPA